MIGGDQRLKRLRELAQRLAQLPPTPERDRLLADVRARAVAVDTGEDTEPRRMLEPEASLFEADSLPPRPSRPATPPPFVAAPKAPPADPQPRAAEEEGGDEDDLGWTTDVLWDDPWPDPGKDDDPPSRPWTLGLRG